MPLEIVRNDITRMSVDAIVNAANSSLKRGGGVCGAIFAAAGPEDLQAECDRIGGCSAGKAVITAGYNLPAKYIIHTVGPVWHGGSFGEEDTLYSCYISSLELAQKSKCTSIAFPLISSGIFGYPKDLALQTAISAIGTYLLKHEMKVYLVVYDHSSFVLSEKLFSAINNYIDDNYVEEHKYSRRDEPLESIQKYVAYNMPFPDELSAPVPSAVSRGHRSLEDVLRELDETFPEMLLRLIDQKGKTDVETYKRANIDRKLFSKIRSGKDYTPSKVTAIAFAIALELSLDETKDLLGKAGYTLSHSNKFDVIIEFFIERGNYNIFEINESLFAFKQPLLGA